MFRRFLAHIILYSQLAEEKCRPSPESSSSENPTLVSDVETRKRAKKKRKRDEVKKEKKRKVKTGDV